MAVELYRGVHVCELCVEPPDLEKTTMANRIVVDPNCSWAIWVAQRSSNGEIRVVYGGMTFAAPVLIVHYIEEHGYLSRAQFFESNRRSHQLIPDPMRRGFRNGSLPDSCARAKSGR
jgi:hypothetical protein